MQTTMRRISSVALTIVMLLLSAASYGQDNNRKGWQERIKAEKIAFLTDAMDLSPAEAERFWPIYNKAEAETREQWKATMDAYRALEEGIKTGKDEKEISALLDRYTKALNAGNHIEGKYLEEYRKILSNKKIAKLFIGEENFRRMQIHKLNKNDNSKNDRK